MDNVVLNSVADLQKLINGSTNSQSMALLNSVMAETIGMTMYNAVSTQHNAQMLNTAATTSTCAKILSVIGVNADLSTALGGGTNSSDPNNTGQGTGSTTDSGTGTQASPPSGGTETSPPGGGTQASPPASPPSSPPASPPGGGTETSPPGGGTQASPPSSPPASPPSSPPAGN